MTNKHRGEVELEIGGDLRTLRYDMNALATLEGNLQDKPISLIFAEDNIGIKVIREALLVGLQNKGFRRLTRTTVGEWMANEPERLPDFAKAVTAGISQAMGVDEDDEEGEEAKAPLPEAVAEPSAA